MLRKENKKSPFYFNLQASLYQKKSSSLINNKINQYSFKIFKLTFKIQTNTQVHGIEKNQANICFQKDLNIHFIPANIGNLKFLPLNLLIHCFPAIVNNLKFSPNYI